MQVSLCSAFCKPAAVFSSKPLKLPFCPSDLPTSEGVSQGVGTFPLSELPPRGAGLVLLTFFFFPVILPHYMEIFLALLGSEIFCPCSVGIL